MVGKLLADPALEPNWAQQPPPPWVEMPLLPQELPETVWTKEMRLVFRLGNPPLSPKR